MRLFLLIALLLDPSPRPEVGAAQILHDWDVRRSAAWASGDVAALRSLYVPGSAAGRSDVAMLRAWHARGMRVSGMRMQLLSVSVRSASERRLVLDVVDRVAGGVVRPVGGALPVDRPTSHTVVLRRVEGEWRMVAVS